MTTDNFLNFRLITLNHLNFHTYHKSGHISPGLSLRESFLQPGYSFDALQCLLYSKTSTVSLSKRYFQRNPFCSYMQFRYYLNVQHQPRLKYFTFTLIRSQQVFLFCTVIFTLCDKSICPKKFSKLHKNIAHNKLRKEFDESMQLLKLQIRV